MNPEEDRGDNITDDSGLENIDEGKSEAPAPEDEAKPEADAEAAKDDATEDDESGDEDEDVTEDDAEEGKATKTNAIPLARFNKINARRKDAEQRAQRLEQELQALRTSTKSVSKIDEVRQQIDELYDKVEEARAEGDSKQAASLQRQLDNLKANLSRAEAQHVAKSEAVAAQRQAAYDAVLEQLELLVPELNEDADEFDNELAQEVAAIAVGYETSLKLPPHLALKRAAKRVLGRDVFAETTSKSPLKQRGTKKTDVKKNLDAERRQPPKIGDDKRDKPGNIDVSALTEEEFDALPESKKRALRGDL